MKKLLFILISILLIGYACKRQKNIESTSIEIKTPLDNKNNKTDKNYFRSVGYGESYNLNNAIEIAKSQSRSDISRQVNVIIKDVIERYNNEIDNENGNMYQSLSRQVSISVLKNIKEKDKYLLQDKKTKKYKYWVVLEVNKNDVIHIYNNNIKNQNIKYNKEKFENIYNDEINKSLNLKVNDQ
jgi:hypothetical protein